MAKYAGFSSVELKKPSRSSFDLSHTKRLTCKMGNLVPVLITECVPSDSFRGGSEVLVRLAPLLAPIYDQIQLFVHFFFVPNRLIWEDWEEFITGGRLGVGIDPVTAPVPPFFDIGTILAGGTSPLFRKGSLADYLGVPIFEDQDAGPANWDGLACDAMPMLAYQLVWYEYYRDRNFISDDVFEFPFASGEILDGAGDAEEVLALQMRNYAHDYFTSALPFTQRGEEVLMPLAGTGSVTYLTDSLVRTDPPITPADIDGTLQVLDGELQFNDGVGISGARIENIDEVILTASSVSINDFRSAYALQVWLERNAIGGSRYTESTQAHFGVKPQDSRLQRPEYIGGGRIMVKISEVVSTAWSNDGSATVPLANMAGHGVAYGDTNRFNYFCTEHGFIIGIASFMNPASYMQGLPRMFRRRSFLDYPWPTFAKLGEQPVNNYEIWCDPVSLTEDTAGEVPLFGYQSRYADWKYICNSTHGDFRDTLLFWTLTRQFVDTPILGADFNQFDQTTAERIFAAQVEPDTDQLWLYVFNKVNVKRPLPYFGVPNTLNF